MERPDPRFPVAPAPIVLGLDPGQRRDPSGIAVVEVSSRPSGRTRTGRSPTSATTWEEPIRESTFTVRAVHRLPLGTPYETVARLTASIVRTIRLADAETPADEATFGNLERPRRLVEVRVDVTGLGRPVFEMVERELLGSGARAIACTLVSGQGFERKGGWSVSKAYLTTRLQALLETGRLRVAAGTDAEALLEELRTFEVRRSEAGRFLSGAFRSGAHDDLAIAVGLAIVADPAVARVVPMPVGWL